MTRYEKHLIVALSVSAFALALNIIAVSTGMADPVYTEVNHWLSVR